MALNLKNLEVETLAAEVAELAGESKTEAIRKALMERKSRLTEAPPHLKRSERAASIVEQFRASLPREFLGRPLTREEEDDILGYGPGGV